MNILAINKTHLLLGFSLTLALLLSAISTQLLMLILLLLGIGLVFYFGEKALITIIIVGYLTTPGEYFGDLRVYINLFLSITLFIIYIKKYGISFNGLAKLPNALILFVIFLFAGLSLSTLFSAYTFEGLFAIIRTGILLLLFYMFYALLRDESNIYVYIFAILCSFFIYSIRILLDFFNYGIENYFIRSQIESSIGSHGSLSYTGLTIFFFSISFIVAAFFLGEFKSRLSRLSLSILFLINIIILILANSRGGILAAIISSSFIVFILKRKMLLKAISGGVVLILLLLIIDPKIGDAVELYLRIDQVSTRQVFWDSGLEIAGDNFWVGVGTDVFDKYFFSYAPSSIYSLVETFSARFGRAHPHNFFLHYLAENGILGLIASISFFVLFFYLCIKTISFTKTFNREYYILSVAITGVGIGLFVRSFFEVTGFLYYGFISTDLPFWLIFGILVFFHEINKNELFSN